MPDIPEAAVRAVSEAIGVDKSGARTALEAAAPALARDLLGPLLKRHPRIEGGWGPCCGTCWVRGGSRAAWPCAEVLAISALLPVPGDGEKVPGA